MLTKGQIDLAIKSKVIYITKYLMEQNNLSIEESYKMFMQTKIYELLENSKTGLFLKPVELVIEAYRIETTQSEEEMIDWLLLD